GSPPPAISAVTWPRAFAAFVPLETLVDAVVRISNADPPRTTTARIAAIHAIGRRGGVGVPGSRFAPVDMLLRATADIVSIGTGALLASSTASESLIAGTP